jgi:hypothetical protein
MVELNYGSQRSEVSSSSGSRYKIHNSNKTRNNNEKNLELTPINNSNPGTHPS